MFFFQAEDGIRDIGVTGVQTCALPIFIQSLINKGLVEKVRCKEDKRQNKIYLTERGQDLIYPIYSVLDSWVGILTADMTKEEKDMAYHYLERMAKNVERIFNGTSKKNNSSK